VLIDCATISGCKKDEDYIRVLKQKYWGEEEFQNEILFMKQYADEGSREVIIEHGRCIKIWTFGKPNLPKAKKYFKIGSQKGIYESVQNYIRESKQKYW
jgi:hypothetical protein